MFWFGMYAHCQEVSINQVLCLFLRSQSADSRSSLGLSLFFLPLLASRFVHSRCIFQPLWSPIGVLPDPPTFPTWLSHPGLQILPANFIDRFLLDYPSEIWAQIIQLADELSKRYELIAPWFSRHDLRLHHIAMQLFLACVILCRSRSDPDFQPGTTFADPCTP
jgi:hypothetical protein